jgi:branched-chain amino acid transport system ATP-binding protein
MNAGRSSLRLAVRDLSHRFGGLVAVNNVSLDLHAGEILGLIGPNGSGKSTLMKLLMGVLRPTHGSIVLNNFQIAGWPAHRVARAGVGIVFQHSRHLPRQTVLEHIKLGLLSDSLTTWVAPASLQARALQIAARLGLQAVVNRLPASLAFADLRRMEIAKAIARDPQVVLIDEPFAGLNAAEVLEFSDLIRSLRDEGRAVLLVDHNVKGVVALVDRVVALYLGSVVAQGAAREVMADETVRRVYLGGKLEVAKRAPARGEGPPLLELADLNVTYGKAQALNQVSLQIREREFVSIVGLNGAGKTTLFNAISGMLPYAGSIRLAGQDLAGKSGAQIARQGVIQCPETRELFGHLSVGENLQIAGLHLPKAERRAQLEWLLELLPILRSRFQAGGRDPERRRAANAGHLPLPHVPAAPADARRAVARACAADTRAPVQGAGAPAAKHPADRPAVRAERHFCAAARRPAVRAGKRQHRLERDPGPV